MQSEVTYATHCILTAVTSTYHLLTWLLSTQNSFLLHFLHPTHSIHPVGIVVDSATHRGYVANFVDDPTGSLVAVINTEANTLLDRIVVGTNVEPIFLDIDSTLNKLYVTLRTANSVAVFDIDN